MPKTATRILIGLVVSTAIFAFLFYFFLFANPFRIYEVQQLKWIPILIIAVSTYTSGLINKNTPIKWLPILLLPLILLKPFNYFYFPFILVVILVGILMLIASRHKLKNKNIAWIGATILFAIFLFKQPLILQKAGFDYDNNGKIINATTLWDFSSDDSVKVPDHNLQDINGKGVNLNTLKGKNYFLTFWATWCAPCMESKPAIAQLKSNLKDNASVAFVDISFDQSIDIWKNYLLEHSPKGTQFFSDNHQLTSRLFEFNGLPMYIIVDEQGNYKKYVSFEVAKNILAQTITN